MDDATLNSWSALLALTEAQTAATLADIEDTLRVGFDNRPDELRHLTFDEATSDMEFDEVALMFLIGGLRQAGHQQAAFAVEVRGLDVTLTTLQQAS
ncbi:hypothetical protein ACFWY6_00820 [Streptomyces sp. NPDC059037]|uniref:hypothetical protein n=1 Tax=Streptomyces sp. NPDC059037 TaxID=3346710 RepID=UPI0036CAE358